MIYSPSKEAHWEYLRIIFNTLRDHKLYVKFSKCNFWLKEVASVIFGCMLSLAFLGHIVSGQGISLDLANVEAVIKWLQPITISEVRSFLGLVGYYRKFVKGFARIAVPLT